jgi:hypothetical protein
MLEAHNPELGQKEGPGLRAASALSLAPIHPSAWKWNSANFAMTDFSEVRVASVPHP